MKNHSEILPDTVTNKANDRMYDTSEKYTWFMNSVNHVSKWSKALKEVV